MCVYISNYIMLYQFIFLVMSYHIISYHIIILCHIISAYIYIYTNDMYINYTYGQVDK